MTFVHSGLFLLGGLPEEIEDPRDDGRPPLVAGVRPAEL